MYVIKSPRKTQYLLRNEDDLSVSFNLVRTQSGASEYTTQQEAIKVRDEAINNAKLTISELSKNKTKDNLDEIADLEEQYLSLIITEKK